jgi:branched-chain amino acid transport system permease protein
MTATEAGVTGRRAERVTGLMAGRWRWLLWAVVAVVVVLLPRQLAATDVNLANEIMWTAVAALALALLTGFNGQISLGHGAFVGLGAYITVIGTVDYDLPYWGAMLLSIVVAFVVGVIVGLPALRITGIYLALVTLGLAVLFPQIAVRLGAITGGGTGRGLQPRPGFGDDELLQEVGPRRYLGQAGFRAPEWTGLEDDQWVFYVFAALTLVVFLLVRNLTRSRVGRGLVAIRDNQTAAEVAGVNVDRYKVVTFGISASIGSIAGWMFAVKNSSVAPTSFAIALSITLLVAAVLGGAASIIGPLLGAAAIVLVREAVPADRQRFSQVILGAVLIIVMLVAPGGIVGIYRQVSASIRRRRARAAGVPPPPGPDGDAPGPDAAAAAGSAPATGPATGPG